MKKEWEKFCITRDKGRPFRSSKMSKQKLWVQRLHTKVTITHKKTLKKKWWPSDCKTPTFCWHKKIDIHIHGSGILWRKLDVIVIRCKSEVRFGVFTIWAGLNFVIIIIAICVVEERKVCLLWTFCKFYYITNMTCELW